MGCVTTVGCLTLTHSLDKGDLALNFDLDKGDIRVDVALICAVDTSIYDYDNVLFHINGPLLVRNGYLLVQKD